jgi:hypothetical protein
MAKRVFQKHVPRFAFDQQGADSFLVAVLIIFVLVVILYTTYVEKPMNNDADRMTCLKSCKLDHPLWGRNDDG